MVVGKDVNFVFLQSIVAHSCQKYKYVGAGKGGNTRLQAGRGPYPDCLQPGIFPFPSSV